jgi:hypothetical protein
VWFVEASNGGTNKNSLCTDVMDANDVYGSGGLDIIDPNNIINGQWHLYTMTVSTAAGVKVYLDGQFRTSATGIGNGPIDPNSAVFIGGRSDSAANRFFGGAIDDVRIYGQTLSPAETRRIEHEVAAQLARELVARLPTKRDQFARLLESGWALAERMSWQSVCRQYLLPALERCLGRPPRRPPSDSRSRRRARV